MQASEESLYRVALTLVHGIGPIKAKKLIGVLGSAERVFHEKKSSLAKHPEIGAHLAQLIHSSNVLTRAERELDFATKNDVHILCFDDPFYPSRLKDCDDCPSVLFSKGRASLNSKMAIAIVGTRKATNYGRAFCERLLELCENKDVQIISGLAHGIDGIAHKLAIKHNVCTIACLAHGLDKMYPPAHHGLAKEILYHGAWVSEFPSETKIEREAFPLRNRLIAGMCDCTVVVETDIRGGSVITAQLASSYARDVFAVPGRFTDPLSAGCNELIRKNIAAILPSPESLFDYMNWSEHRKEKPIQLDLFQIKDDISRTIVESIRESEKLHVDDLAFHLQIPQQSLSGKLLELEFMGLIRSLPGKFYELY